MFLNLLQSHVFPKLDQIQTPISLFLTHTAMDPKSSYAFTLLILISIFIHSAVGDGTSSVFFLDSPSHRYFHSPSSDAASKTSSMSLPEVGAVVSVLLGFAPPVSLSAASSLKLNEVLVPNPFDRPRSVLALEVTGAEGLSIEALRSNIVSENKADIQLLPDADEVSIFSLDEPEAEYSDKELSDFASWLSGSYVNGELTIPLEDNAYLKFQLSKEADKEFVTSLVSLTQKIQRVTERHQHLSGFLHRPSELITGKFDGLKALKEHYGAEGVAKGTKLFSIVMSKMFDSLSEAYKGQIVGVIVCNGRPSVAEESVFNVVFTSHSSARWLEESQALPNSTAIEEVILVRRTVAWITAILLIIATLLGIYFLMYMPLTRDTLLYSNVKFD